MNFPGLSICIPTFNRDSYLEETLKNLAGEDVFQNTNDVEIIVSDNCSDDDTQKICLDFAKKFEGKFFYYRQKENIKDKNFFFVLSKANGVYAKLQHDNLYFEAGELQKLVEFLKTNLDYDIVLLSNSANRLRGIVECSSFDEVVDKISYNITWIGAYCFNNERLKKLANPDRYADLQFSQVAMLAKMTEDKAKIVLYADKIMTGPTVLKKGGYSVPEVFGKNYFTIIDEIYKKGQISKRVYEKHKKEALVKHINKFCFRQKDSDFKMTGYFRYLLPIYKSKFYFYWDLLLCVLYKIRRVFFAVNHDKQKGIKKIRILFISFSFRCAKGKREVANV